ncbi:sugar ABC transporter permease [Paenibacillus montanisoli]|uniref:Sugar ABC transporter permease n=2 Tax=Paenibacillus montanisoli TaxID=2081970 RepID=A0A328UB74_9BACL|nr:sugar ABC transporter permease [Paenibacillus montanisoli]
MYGAQIAFKNFSPVKGISESDWVGLKHFKRFIDSYDFWRIMRNTLTLSLYDLAVGFPLPIVLALSINYANQKAFKKTVQMVTYAPYFISVVVMVGIVFLMLDPRIGALNLIIQQLGFDPVNFWENAGYFKSIYVWSGVWQNIGISCIIYLAALSGIDPSLHEAGVMDGASKFQRMIHIDIPGILPVASVILILGMGQMLNTGFEKILLMQNPLNIRTSEVIDTYVYKVGLISKAPNFSYATAIGFFKSLISLVLLLTVNQIAKKLGQNNLW